MRTSTAKSNGYRCPRCGDETTRDDANLGYVRHKKNGKCDFERGMRDGAGFDPTLDDAPQVSAGKQVSGVARTEGTKQGLREKVESHPVVFFLGVLLAGFTAGVASYKAVLEMAHLEVVGKGEVDKTKESSLHLAAQLEDEKNCLFVRPKKSEPKPIC